MSVGIPCRDHSRARLTIIRSVPPLLRSCCRMAIRSAHLPAMVLKSAIRILAHAAASRSWNLGPRHISPAKRAQVDVGQLTFAQCSLSSLGVVWPSTTFEGARKTNDAIEANSRRIDEQLLVVKRNYGRDGTPASRRLTVEFA